MLIVLLKGLDICAGGAREFRRWYSNPALRRDEALLLLRHVPLLSLVALQPAPRVPRTGWLAVCCDPSIAQGLFLRVWADHSCCGCCGVPGDTASIALGGIE